MNKNAQEYLIDKKFTVRSAMQRMSNVGLKEVFVVDEIGCLYGSLSDGDIRKWILKAGKLQSSVAELCNTTPHYVDKQYVLADVKDLMLENKIECVPVVDEKHKVVDLLIWDEVFAGKVEKYHEKIDTPVVIMAGGKGTRLEPFTTILPKPLIPIGEKPIIEVIMDKFKQHDVNNFYVTINHRARMMRAYFEDKHDEYPIDFVEEKNPLGTVGSLRLIKPKFKKSFIVTNCDVIIESNYSDLVKFHEEDDNALTLVVSCRRHTIAYGVCELDQHGQLACIHEKPSQDMLVNTGMYVMRPDILNLIPKNKRFDITDLIAVLKEKDYKIGVFPVDEKAWIDVGQWEEYYKATRNFREASESRFYE